jgi:hypothetical protein
MRWRAARELSFPVFLLPVAYLVASVASARSVLVLGVLGRNGRVNRSRVVPTNIQPAP